MGAAPSREALSSDAATSLAPRPMAGHRTLDPGMVVRAHRGQSPPRKSGRGGLTPARAAFSQPAPYGLGWSGFFSFASLTSRSAARSASFASDADRPRLWSVLPM